MFSRHTFRGLLIVCILCILASGCAPKIVKPGPGQGQPGPGWQPQHPVLEQQLQAVQANLKAVYFDYDKYTLSPEAQSALQYNAEILRSSPQVLLVSEGHCDERGTAEYNLALGDRRARAVVEFLVSLGIPANRFSTVSYGSEIPVDPGHNEAAWAKNRRVYLRVSK
ncbi:MAG: peptidoglycan-associated lipoprotein Pal [Desulfomonile tiedjei]|nr:peptidoglycan-associated lipoprotein Pal [Desulfomonile tiedjei]